MVAFENKEQLMEIFNKFWIEARKETEVMDKLAKSQVVVRFDIEDPEVHMTINFRNPGPNGEIGTLTFDSDVEPEITVWSKSETTNKFWQNKLSTTVAMARGQVKLEGSVSKALGLLSKIKPLYNIYPEILKEMGLENMIL
ncbi:MAG: SCP2 sterol-binding domain-containing protein [Candidatus Thorarchaeota archaeon]|nr:SCP2 sterol-binding domain-containing protein [Candidatus Thorarchaeota archaeon]